jgi:hypothetical protein
VDWVSIADGTRTPEDFEDKAARYLEDQNVLLINADFRSRTVFREFLVGSTLRELTDEFESEGITADASSPTQRNRSREPGSGAGQQPIALACFGLASGA